mmetsp:Transcript_11332/g.27795  ORF Transcript_11332/g.27795 Transcript_11332/m.27795 type:complete len:235 (-) Transcript_11332:1822-2526(-)
MPVHPLVLGLPQALDNRLGNVFILPRAKPHHPWNHTRARCKLRNDEASLLPVPHLRREHILKGHEREAVPDRAVDQCVRSREERGARCERQFFVHHDQAAWVLYIDLLPQLPHLIDILRVHKVPKPVVQGDCNLHEQRRVAVLLEQRQHRLVGLELQCDPREGLHVIVPHQNDLPPQIRKLLVPNTLLLQHDILLQALIQRVRIDAHVGRAHVTVVPIEDQVQHPPPRGLVLKP